MLSYGCVTAASRMALGSVSETAGMGGGGRPQVEVRGDPHGVFRPREGGLTRIRCFRVVSCCRVVSCRRRLGEGGSGQGARARGLGPEIQKIGKNRQKSKMSRMIQNDSK